LLDAFRMHYYRFESIVSNAMSNSADTAVLQRIGQNLTEYSSLVNQHSVIFEPAEFEQLRSNLSLMLLDVRIRCTHLLEQSHHGRPNVIAVQRSGRPGRPQILFDREFLAWAYNRRSISGLARFLNVGRTTLRNALVTHGIMQPQQQSNERFEIVTSINFGFAEGLIRWKIIIHGFIDGYSRLITGLRASNNNYGDTVLHVFLHA
ncbi:hypothetical protein BDN70DRAFT_763811, partial [Pholiota conissans]